MMTTRHYHTKWSKSDRKHDITYMWNLKKKKIGQINWITKQRQIHRHRKQTYGYQRWKVTRAYCIAQGTIFNIL